MKTINKKEILPIFLIFVFSIISAMCIILQGDDFIWYYSREMEELSPWNNSNGRYFTNQITFFMVKYLPFRYITMSCTFTILLICISRLIDYDNQSNVLKYGLSFSLFVLLPCDIYANVINWISGYTNYVLPILATLFYMLYCYKLMFKSDFFPKKINSIFTAILGFVSALCVEHMTIYNLLFGLVAIILIFKFRKSFFVSNLTYLISGIIGAIFMFSSNQYDEILNGSDLVGIRYAEFNLVDNFMQLYRHVIPNYSKQFIFIHLLILLSFIYMFHKSEKMEWKASTRKYSKICIFICTAYVIYTVFTNFLCDFVILEWGMKIRAIETAFTFLYFISVIYLSVVLLERNNCVRTVIYLISTVIVTAPFIVVEPVTPRCFFIDYIFWILAAGEIFFSVYRSCELLRSSCFKNVISVTACILALFICNIDITNKYYNKLRFDYIKERIENNSEQVYIIKLPYSSYCYDDLDDNELFNNTFFAGFSPNELVFKYYGIEVDKDNFNYLLIDVLDYIALTE